MENGTGPKIYAFVNQKGGVGKTTSAVNVAASMARLGQKVMLVDLDAQANSTSSLGVDKYTVEGGTYQLLVDGDADLAENTLFHSELGIYLVPSSPDLAGAEVELVEVDGREQRLLKAFEQAEDYDYILIDSPPSLSLLTINGLVAAEAVIIPVQCEYLALEGLGQLTQTINRIRSTINPSLSLRGLIMTMYDGRATLAREVVNEVRQFFPNNVFDSIIPRNVRLAEAPSHGLPVTVYAPASSGAKAYENLTKELLEGDGVALAV